MSLTAKFSFEAISAKNYQPKVTQSEIADKSYNLKLAENYKERKIKRVATGKDCLYITENLSKFDKSLFTLKFDTLPQFCFLKQLKTLA